MDSRPHDTCIVQSHNWAADVIVSALRPTFHKTLSCLPYLSFCFMLYCAISSVVEAEGEKGTVFFVVGSLALLGLLYLCMHLFHKFRDSPSSWQHRSLKVSVWLLSVALTALFSFRVTAIVDFGTALSVIIWAVAALTSAMGFFLLFVCK